VTGKKQREIDNDLIRAAWGITGVQPAEPVEQPAGAAGPESGTGGSRGRQPEEPKGSMDDALRALAGGQTSFGGAVKRTR
jgi:hypothetical protein